jgi:hypothetical protein
MQRGAMAPRFVLVGWVPLREKHYLSARGIDEFREELNPSYIYRPIGQITSNV